MSNFASAIGSKRTFVATASQHLDRPQRRFWDGYRVMGEGVTVVRQMLRKSLKIPFELFDFLYAFGRIRQFSQYEAGAIIEAIRRLRSADDVWCAGFVVRSVEPL